MHAHTHQKQNDFEFSKESLGQHKKCIQHPLPPNVQALHRQSALQKTIAFRMKRLALSSLTVQETASHGGSEHHVCSKMAENH